VQEEDPLLHEGQRRRDPPLTHPAGRALGSGPLDKNPAAAMDLGDANQVFYRVDLRSIAAAARCTEGIPPGDAATHWGVGISRLRKVRLTFAGGRLAAEDARPLAPSSAGFRFGFGSSWLVQTHFGIRVKFHPGYSTRVLPRCLATLRPEHPDFFGREWADCSGPGPKF
jgi:hypothetical protein